MNGMEKERQSFLPFLFLCDSTERAGGLPAAYVEDDCKNGAEQDKSGKSLRKKMHGKIGPGLI